MLLSCRLCGKLFNTSGGRTCPACQTRLEELYPRVREYLRDNPKINFNVETIADEMDVDIRDIQGLVDQGYLDRDVARPTDHETVHKQKLAQEFEKSLKQMQGAAARQNAAKNAASYGQQRYGDKNK